MSEFWELPLLMNETSQQKYSRYTVYESQATRAGLGKRKAPRREARNPFECLNRIPHPSTIVSYTNLKSLHLSRSRFDNSPSLDLSHSLMPTLPPLTSVTAPRGSALKAYEEVHAYARDYLRNCKQETMQQLSVLKQLHGSISSLNRRIREINRLGIIILDPVLSIIFESLQAEQALREERVEDAVPHFRKAEFYSLKMEQYFFASYCLLEQADIYKSEGKLERGLHSLKKALGLAILSDNRELQLTVLEKMGMLYYYNGNTAMGEQYHRLAERGLSIHELQIFKNEFCLQTQIWTLEKELFSLQPLEKPQTKQFSRYEEEVNSDLQTESVQQNTADMMLMVSHMLKDNHEKNVGVKFKKHIRSTLSLARIIPHSHSPPRPTNSKENLPFVNVSQVLKSHLSKNRGGTRPHRDWQIRTLLQMIDSLARCLP